MKEIILSCIVVINSLFGYSQSFPDFVNYINALPIDQRQGKVDSFMIVNQHSPFIESETHCHFLFKGNASSVKVAGDFTHWEPSLSMSSIQGTNLWYLSSSFEPDARLDYKYVIDGKEWILDPGNKNLCQSGFGSNSELRMPKYQAHPEIAYYSDIPHGSINDFTLVNHYIETTREIRIYLPPGYDTQAKEYPIILFHDGFEYLSIASTANTLDYLIAKKEIQPIIGIFVPPINRTEEYNGKLKDDFTKFIINVLLPMVDSKFQTSKRPVDRATLGASSGGNISLYLAMKHPESFGKVAVQSSSVEPIISTTFSTSRKSELEFYLDYGTYDIPIIVDWTEKLVKILKEKGYTYQFQKWHEGHSWGSWRDHLSLPLKQFFPYTK